MLNFFKKRKTTTTQIDDLFDNPFFNDINYPIIITISIYVIYRNEISKFYAIDFSIIDIFTDRYQHPILKDLTKHIKSRIYNENYVYMYHLQNFHKHKTIEYLNLGIDDMYQKIYTKIIHNDKDHKEYLDLVLFKSLEPFIEKISDVYF